MKIDKDIDRYLITMDRRTIPIMENAMIEFMGGVFKLAEESKCVGHGLIITKIDVPVLDSDGQRSQMGDCDFIINMHDFERHRLLEKLHIESEEGDK